MRAMPLCAVDAATYKEATIYTPPEDRINALALSHYVIVTNPSGEWLEHPVTACDQVTPFEPAFPVWADAPRCSECVAWLESNGGEQG